MIKLSTEEKLQIIKNKCQLIVDIGFDYDGYKKSKDLMKLIDEIVQYAGDCIKIIDNINNKEG